MRFPERFIKSINDRLRLKNGSLLRRIGGGIASVLYTMDGCVYRNLGGDVEVKIGPEFRCISEDYEIDSMKLVCGLLCKGDTAVDVGANIGLYSLLMGHLVGKGGKVYSFEPSQQSFNALLGHIELNSLAEVIEANQVLVGSEASARMFYEDGMKGTNRVGDSSDAGVQPFLVARPTVVLDDFLASKGRWPKLIKIDVEGYEIKVLQGARETLKASACTVLCEVHSNVWNKTGNSWRELSGLMAEVNYGLYDLKGEAFRNFAFFDRMILVLRPVAR